MILNLIIATAFSCTSTTYALKEAMYMKTINMTMSTWNAYRSKEFKTSGVHACASHCLYLTTSCNSWNYNKQSQICQLGKVSCCDKLLSEFKTYL